MRIISGTYKGKRIIAPKKLPVRPTTDLAKESLFNILNNHYYFEELAVLDLFAGTGNISYEFASRGTQQITAVDQHAECLRFINRTARELNFSINTIKSDVFKFLEKVALKADLVFADPPYDFTDGQFAKIPQLVFGRQLLNKNGMLVIEHSRHTRLSKLPDFGYDKKYGGSVFSFFENEE